MTTPGSFADANQRYRLDSRIATGGMGEVWRGTDTALGRPVAVKLLRSEYADDPTFRSRFADEARHAAALHHPGVASVYDVGEAPSTDGSGQPVPFLVMELVDGEPLSVLLRGGRRLDPLVMRDLLAQAADAIGAAHRAGIVHRDVKPANLMVTPDRRVKITDFGIARATDGLGLTGTGQVMGTPQYLSPEQARGSAATPASDVYSLGVVAWECLAGHRPFDAGTPVATALAHLNQPVPPLPDDVPSDLAAVVERSLAKEPTQRFADGDALAAALRDPATAATQVVAAPTPRGVPPPAVVPDVTATQVMPAAGPPAAGTRRTPVPPVPPVPPHDLSRPVDREPERGIGPWGVFLAIVALGAVAVLLYVLLTREDAAVVDSPDPTPATSAAPSQTPSDTPTPTEEPEPERIDLDEGAYLGRDVDDVSAELLDRGLRVDVEEIDNPGDETEGAVESLDPTDDLQEGETVRVRYFGAAPDPEPTTPTAEPTEEESEGSSGPGVATPPGQGGENPGQGNGAGGTVTVPGSGG